MASKGGVIAVAGIVGLGALLAFTAKAKASPGTKPGPEPEVSPHTPEACATAKAQRAQFQSAINAANNDLVEIDAALMAAYANNDSATAANLESIKAQVKLARNNYQGEVNALNTYIADCP